jgi:hypothetical protein
MLLHIYSGFTCGSQLHVHENVGGLCALDVDLDVGVKKGHMAAPLAGGDTLVHNFGHVPIVPQPISRPIVILFIVSPS